MPRPELVLWLATASIVIILAFAPAVAAFADHTPNHSDVQRAVRLKLQGNLTAAVELYERALDSDRGTLALDSGGLLEDLIARWALRAATGDPAARFRSAYLDDIAGRVERARDGYSSLAAGPDKAWTEKARSNLAILDREREVYDRFLEEMRKRAAAETARDQAATERRLRAEAAADEAATQQAAQTEQQAAERQTDEQEARRLADATAERDRARREAWRAKRDWRGYDGARKWRGKPGEPDLSYDGTLRRRYRQAEGEAQDREREVKALQSDPAPDSAAGGDENPAAVDAAAGDEEE